MSTEKVKVAVRKRDQYRCTECGLTQAESLALRGSGLEVHRLTPGSLYTLEGCITLCKTCHGPKPKRESRQPDLALESPRVVFYLPQELLDLIDSQAEASDRTRTAEIIRALKAHYHAQGLWPPPKKD